MSVVAHVLRTIGAVQLERNLVLVVPPVPGMLLNLGSVAAGGVLAIERVILVPRDDGPGLKEPGVVILLAAEPAGNVETAKVAGWKEVATTA